MDEDGISRIADWLVFAGLSGESEMEILRGFAGGPTSPRLMP